MTLAEFCSFVQFCRSFRVEALILIGINVGAITMDRLLASIKFFDELDATVSKNYKMKQTVVI